jgi:phosphonate transport system permease protein
MTAALDIRRDPALRGRLLAILAALVVLWPTLVVTEFKPWILLDEQSLSATGRFLADFLVPAHSAEFLDMLLRETWNTVAIATAGLRLRCWAPFRPR